MDWTELETTTHQDHIVKHVIGATVLGWFIAGEAAHFLLDIGFLWTIYLDGEMNLLPHGVALSEIEADDLTPIDKSRLSLDSQLLLTEGSAAQGLKIFKPAAVDCLITSVEFFGADSWRRIVVNGEAAKIIIQASLDSFELTVEESAGDA